MKRKRTTHTMCFLSSSSFVCYCAEKREMFPSQWSSHYIKSMWNHAERKKRRTAIAEKSANDDEGDGEAKHYKCFILTYVQSNNICVTFNSDKKKSIRINYFFNARVRTPSSDYNVCLLSNKSF
jgi:hypothetical protein